LLINHLLSQSRLVFSLSFVQINIDTIAAISLNILCVLELALEKDLDFWDLDILKMVQK
jgi:hypothetical protein